MKKIGAVTIGQAPRTDILEDVGPLLGPDIELLQAGALDGMTLGEVQSLRPDGGGNTLVSRMRDGTAVTLEERKLLPLMQKRIAWLEEQGAGAVLIMCTGEFPDAFVSRVPLIFPSKVICNIIGALDNVKSIGVITPDAAQLPDVQKKWGRIVPRVVPVLWNPYLEKTSPAAAARLREENVDLAVMDCFGYNSAMRDDISAAIGRPVILSRTIAARVLLEIV